MSDDDATTDLEAAFAAARTALEQADALVVCAGAGMGVDSGLPDFRGDEGFWNAYPPFKALGLRFAELANPRWFEREPSLAWGFYGHRLQLYRDTAPHDGFRMLREFGARLPNGMFAFTSNVDGHFQRAGVPADRVCEIHGSIHHLQCTRASCRAAIRSADEVVLHVDPSTIRALPPFPTCACGTIERPNILMFGDGEWRSDRTDEQEATLSGWLQKARGKRIVVVELGAGVAVPTVRAFSEALTRRYGATLVRINPREPLGPPGTISIASGALAALRRILPQ